MLSKKGIFKYLIASYFFVSTTGAVYSQNVIKTDTTGFITLRIDPSTVMGGNASDLFEDVNYIPLETTSESTFGSITQLAVIGNYYIILDYDTNCILFFDKAGKFQTKIKGRTDDPKYKIWKFLVNRWTNQIAYCTNNFKTTVYCDFNGKVVRTVEDNYIDPTLNSLSFARGFFISPNENLVYTQYADIDIHEKNYTQFSRSLLKYVSNSGAIYSIGMPYSIDERKIDVLNAGNGPLTYFGNDTTFYFSKPYDYCLYTVTPNAIKLAYKFIFPQAISLPLDFSSNSKYNGNRISFIKKNPHLIHNLNSCFPVGNNLLFKTNYYDRKKEDLLIYNLKSGSLTAYKMVLPDESSFYLPLYDESTSKFNTIGIAACDGENIYTSLSSFYMFKAKEDNTDHKVNYSEALRHYFESASKKDNPVILQLKIKNDL